MIVGDFTISLKDIVDRNDIYYCFSSFFLVNPKNIIELDEFWELDDVAQLNNIAVRIDYLPNGLKTLINGYWRINCSSEKFLQLALYMSRRLKTDVVIGDDFYENSLEQDRVVLIQPDGNIFKGFSIAYDGINDIELEK